MTIFVPDNPRLNVWRDRIERSKKFRKKQLKDVAKYIKFMQGDQWGDRKVTITEKPVINLIFSHIKTQLPNLYFQNPNFYCRPKQNLTVEDMPRMVNDARLAQFFLNYYTKENLGIALKKQVRLAILDAFFCYGVIKVGYTGNFEINTNFGKNKVLAEEPDGTPVYETDPVTGEVMKDEDEHILTNEAFYARRVSPLHILIDPECENYFEDGRYIAQEIVKSVQDVKNSKLYENTDDLNASFNLAPAMEVEGEDLEDNPELKNDLGRITIYEIYDLEHDKLIVLADGHDKFIRDERVPAGIEGSPFEFLRLNEVPDKPYPMSDIKPLKSLQEEYNLGRGMIMTHAKRYGRKYGYKEGDFPGEEGETELEKLKDPNDGTLFKYWENMPEVLEDAKLDPAVYANFSQTLQDFREVAGSTEMDRGVVERRKTAFEASKISGASSIRKEDKRSLVADFMAGIGLKFLQSMQANLTLENAVEIAGEVGRKWVSINQENIAGGYNVGVELGSLAPKIPELERQELMQVLQFVSQMPPELVITKVNFGGMLKSLPRYFPLLTESDLLNSPEEEKKMMQWLTQMKQKQQKSGER